MAKAEERVPQIEEPKAPAALPAEQVPELYALVALFGLVVSGMRAEKPMGRKEHDEWMAERAWSMASAMQTKKPRQ